MGFVIVGCLWMIRSILVDHTSQISQLEIKLCNLDLEMFTIRRRIKDVEGSLHEKSCNKEVAQEVHSGLSSCAQQSMESN